MSSAVLTFSVKPETLNTSWTSSKGLSDIVDNKFENDKIHYCNEVNDDSSNKRYRCGSHGLMGSIARAYSAHVPLVLRPDDIWNAIAIAFGKYVVEHSEEMRSCFVAHSGQKELSIMAGSSFSTAQWDVVLNMMKNEIEKHVDTKITNWLEPNFSTTTPTDKLISNIVLMGAMQKYFSYKMCFQCGLSSVTLKGTSSDWQHLVAKAKDLRNYGQKVLNDWADLLVPVLEKIAESYELAVAGQPIDEKFWQRICTYETRGSGGQKTYRGWFLVFAPFADDGRYMLNSKEDVAASNIYGVCDDDDIASGFISVPVTIDDNGNVFKTKFFAGSASMMYDDVKNEISPGADWGIVISKPSA